MKTKVIKHKFEDQEDTGTTPDEDGGGGGDAVTPATPTHWGSAAATGRVEPPLAPSTASGPAPSPGGIGAASKRAAGGGGRMLGPKADAD